MTATGPSGDEHTRRMQALQADQRERVRAARDPGRGLVLVHTGDGKGKSSAAFGVVARALGWGQRVGVVQFIKGKWVTGERRFFERFPDELTWRTMGEGFTWDTQDRVRDVRAAQSAFEAGCGMMDSGDFDLVVLDEVNVVLSYGYLDVHHVLEALTRRSPRTSVVLTGRGAPPELIAFADTVSEIAPVKHAFQDGIRAKKGIDF